MSSLLQGRRYRKIQTGLPSQRRDGCNHAAFGCEFPCIGAALRGPYQAQEEEHIMPNTIVRITLVAAALSIGTLPSVQAQDSMKKDSMKPDAMKSDGMKSDNMKMKKSDGMKDGAKSGNMKSDGMKQMK